MKAEENPFRSSAVAKLRFRLGASEQQKVLDHLRLNGWFGCILGPEGTGKTTLLEDLETSARGEGVAVEWIRLSLDSGPEEFEAAIQRVTEMEPGDCCFFDGGEVLGWLRWRKLIKRVQKRGCGLIATVHRGCPLPVVYRTGAELSRTLSLAKQLAGHHWTQAMKGVAETAFRESHGNAREVFRACYWHCAMSQNRLKRQ